MGIKKKKGKRKEKIGADPNSSIPQLVCKYMQYFLEMQTIVSQ